MTADSIELLLADQIRQVEARAALRDELDRGPTTMAYMTWRGRLPPADTIRPIAVLSSFTIETIDPFLEVEAYLSEWRVAPTYIQYEQWRSALFDDDALGEMAPEAVVVLLHPEEVDGQPEGGDGQALDLLETGLHAFRSKRATPVFVGLVGEAPNVHGLGLGPTSNQERARALGRANDRILGIARDVSEIHVLDVSAWSAAFGADWYDRKSYLRNGSAVSQKAMPALARNLARNIGCLFRPRRKVLAVDLDNTLWGGIVGEDGLNAIALGEDWPGPAYVEFQRFLRQLRASGVLLAMVSKNEIEDARAVFSDRKEMILSWDDFSAHRVNWDNKADNLMQVAETLGVGLDTIAFADDSPIECALVREMLPMVDVVELGNDPSRFAELILRTQAFDSIAISKEDTIRADSYLAEQKRRDMRRSVEDLESFLAGLDLTVRIQHVDAGSVHRVHQLLNRTNQFNASLERPTLESVMERIDQCAGFYCASLSDRFGDYGIVAVIELQEAPHGMSIQNLCMSCRALGRRVEDGLLAFCCDLTTRNHGSPMYVKFTKGPRNRQVKSLLERLGFEPVDTSESTIDFCINLDKNRIRWPAHVEVELPDKGMEKAS